VRERPAAIRKPLASPIVFGALLAAVGLFTFLALIVVSAGVYTFYQAGHIMPGVRAGEVRLGGMSLAQAGMALDRHWNLESSLLVTNGIQSLAVRPIQLGLNFDALQTAQKAYDVGHIGTLLSRSAQMFASLKDGWLIAPVVGLDAIAARRGLEALAPNLSKSPKDATVRLENGSLIAVSGELGYTINIEETLAALEAAPQVVMASGILRVVPMPIPPSVTDVSPALAEAQRLLDIPLTIQAYDAIRNELSQWPVPRQEVGAWLKIEPGEQGPRPTLDEVQVEAYLAQISGNLGAGRFFDANRYGDALVEAILNGRPAVVTISHAPTLYTVQPGDTLLKIGWRMGFPMWVILKANPGLDPNNLAAGTQITIPSKDDLLPLPVVPNKRIVINMSQQRLMVYQEGKLLSKNMISTGIDRSPTQPGVFQVQTHDPNAYASVWDLYMPNFLGIYEAWPGFMNGIHGLPLLSNGQRLWANVLGQPASYGCIILDLKSAEWLYNWAENGVVVEIVE
jgi:lipoprotein-anchoring transpeptidase ErfK/SrfK